MPLPRTLGAVALSLAGSALVQAGTALDKTAVEQFIRYTEGYTSMVKIAVDDPVPSPFKNFQRLLVHLSMGPQKIDKTYFVGDDGQIVNGTIWNLHESPFLEAFQHLPRNGPAFGPANAKVTMVVFSDFQCPYCRQFAKTIREELPKKYPNDVRVEFQDFPIESIHKWAEQAAEAAHCIGDGQPSLFWAFHDWIFEHQQEITPTNVKDKAVEFAKAQKIDSAKVGACMDNHAAAAKVTEGLQAGQILGVQQTPTSFINGRIVSGAVEPANLDAIIKLELDRPSQVPGPPASKSSEAKVLNP